MKKQSNKANNMRDRKKIIRRMIANICLFLLLLVLGILFLNKSLHFKGEKVVNYSEKSNLDYKVYLKENDFYDEPYLGKDMVYVANLIDKLVVDFDYNFNSEEKENLTFTYSVIAKLSIGNLTGTKLYFEKNYPILSDKSITMENDSKQAISEEISVDYPYYNSLANSFKKQYGVETDSKLTIYMLINKKNTDDSDLILNSNSAMNVVVPLSERSVDIKLDYKDIDEKSNIIKKQTMKPKDYIPYALAGICIVLSLVMMVKAMRNAGLLYNKKSEYEKKIAKILKEYDRLIAESSSLMSFDNKEIITISKFSELLDIHDNLLLPIMYYEVKKHELSYFYISHENTIYLLKIMNKEKH